jgi:polyisoprenoid-binding protein YceI
MAFTLALLGHSAQSASYIVAPSQTTVHLKVRVFPNHALEGTVSTVQGEVQLDTGQKTGRLHVLLDSTSVDFGNLLASGFAKSRQFLDSDRFHSIEFEGTEFEFERGAPVHVQGKLTMRGVRVPVRLRIVGFRCHSRVEHFQVCEAQITGELPVDRLGFSGPLAGVIEAITLTIHTTAATLE